jgi:hypothetical protein
MDATFFFDPACPWTWRTARWLVTVAEARDLTIEWRAFSLAALTDDEPPPEHAAPMAASTRALRLVEALHEAGRGDDTARFYTELGTRSHDAGERLSDAIVDAAAHAAEIGPLSAALEDPTWDDAVRRSHERAYASAGPDIGSPVLLVPGADRGVHGPIVTDLPDPGDALVLWDALLPLLRMPAFHEIKRGRR